eukprot:gene6383-6615_t
MVVNCQLKPERLVASVAAAGFLLASPPAFASLPEGFKSPQGSAAIALEAKLDELIEKRTGKAEALPELTEIPEEKVPAEKEKPAPAPFQEAATRPCELATASVSSTNRLATNTRAAMA